MDQLGNILRRERALLELVLFKLIEIRLLLAAGETRFLARAAGEVERTRQRTREADLVRAAVVDQFAKARPDARAPTLRGLAADADEPWARILRDHHDAMCELVAEIELVAHQNARHACQGLEHTERQPPAPRRLTTLGGTPLSPAEADVSLLAVKAAYDAVLGAGARLRMPALLTFLR